MNDKYQEVLAWEAEFAQEIQASKVTYKEKNEGARFIVTHEGFERGKKVYKIWDRQEKKHIPGKYTSKRSAQNVIDEM